MNLATRMRAEEQRNLEEHKQLGLHDVAGPRASPRVRGEFVATLVGFVLAQKYRYLPWNIASIFYALAILFLATSAVVAIDYWQLS